MNQIIKIGVICLLVILVSLLVLYPEFITTAYSLGIVYLTFGIFRDHKKTKRIEEKLKTVQDYVDYDFHPVNETKEFTTLEKKREANLHLALLLFS